MRRQIELPPGSAQRVCLGESPTAREPVGPVACAHTQLGGVLMPAFGHDPDAARNLLAAARQHTWHGVHR